VSTDKSRESSNTQNLFSLNYLRKYTIVNMSH
jgi:hypothetical protein